MYLSISYTYTFVKFYGLKMLRSISISWHTITRHASTSKILQLFPSNSATQRAVSRPTASSSTSLELLNRQWILPLSVWLQRECPTKIPLIRVHPLFRGGCCLSFNTHAFAHVTHGSQRKSGGRDAHVIIYNKPRFISVFSLLLPPSLPPSSRFWRRVFADTLSRTTSHPVGSDHRPSL